jgi:DNA-directed RNA polymerase subunit beta'
LVCTAFNADFDGDQMAVHLPLGNAAILEAQVLMLASHNILNPASGEPIAVPSQDMILGLYYMTKERKLENGLPVKGTGLTYYSPEETIIAYNEGKAALQSACKIKVEVLEGDVLISRMVETTVGRVLFNQLVPREVGFINEVIKKKNLKSIIAKVIKRCGMARAAQFLDDIKAMGYYRSFKGGLSFNLEDVVVPKEKVDLIQEGHERVEQVTSQYEMGFITNNERYQQVVDIWNNVNDKLSETVMKTLSSNNDGFNSVFMMLDSGARGSKDQIRQLSGMRGLMAKPQKSGTAAAAEIIENPIISNFKEGMSVLEYFISTHGARKGLADTALKTADAGYLTRRLVDVAQDVIITQEDCGTIRGIVCTPLFKKDEVVETLGSRVLGRTSVYDVVNPLNGHVIVKAGEEINDKMAAEIDASPIEQIEIRSVLTCESRRGVCARCYGRNLATNRPVQIGEAVGTIAAQSIGEPGTQLTLRTFHGGGVAGTLNSENTYSSRYDGYIQISELRSVPTLDSNKKPCEIVISRLAEASIVDSNTNMPLTSTPVQYGSYLYFKNGDNVKKGDIIFSWDPFNVPMIAENSGRIVFQDLIQGVTYNEDTDEATGFSERVIIESKDKSKNPSFSIVDESGNILETKSLPVTALILKNEGDIVEAGEIIVKIPRAVGSHGDITGGLPRVTELFEARNPSFPAVVSEIDGIVSMGRIKRGNREISIKSRDGSQEKKYLVSLSKQIIVQEGDFIKAGTPLSDGAVTPTDILDILGPTAVQEYIVNEVQEVYRLQGVKINDKHFEVIVRQMMRKVKINDPGDTNFLESEVVDKWEFFDENDRLFGKKLVVDAGDSETLKPGQIVSLRKLRDENSLLIRKGLRPAVAEDAKPATSCQILQGITRASLQTSSFMSAASFQETTRVLNEAAISGKVDYMEGLKENVIVGHLIPAGTGMRRYDHIQVGPKENNND